LAHALRLGQINATLLALCRRRHADPHGPPGAGTFALLVNALIGLLVPPVSWSHHWNRYVISGFAALVLAARGAGLLVP
jgi:hypothetical protein